MSIWRPLAASLFGAALLGVPAGYYQITRLECTAHYSAYEHLFACGSYLLAIGLLTAGWVGMLRRTAGTAEGSASPSFGAVLGLGALVQLLSLCGLPFLSLDPLFYASLGRAAARFSGSPFVPLCDSLPPGDAFLRLLPGVWRCGTSAYGAGFNSLTALIARIGGDSVTYQLRLYQLLGLGTMVLTAALTGLAARAAFSHTKQDRAPWAAALVLFSPLSVIEGTLSAHNDVFLALAAAGFAFFATRRRPLWAGVAVLSALLIKLSALLLAGFYVAWQAVAGARRFLRPGQSRHLRAGVIALLGAAAAGVIFLSLRSYWTVLQTPAHAALSLIGNPTSHAGHCTRSVECLPRAFLIWIAHAPTAAWIVGLVFRVLGALWLFYAAVRAAKEQNPLRWAAIFVFFYYLYLHGYMQSWYFLPLLPFLPFLSDRLRRVALVVCVCAVSYYVLYIPIYCGFSADTPVLVTLSEVGQAAVVIIPPTVALLWRASVQRRS